jgi:hypothetical protein
VAAGTTRIRIKERCTIAPHFARAADYSIDTNHNLQRFGVILELIGQTTKGLGIFDRIFGETQQRSCGFFGRRQYLKTTYLPAQFGTSGVDHSRLSRSSRKHGLVWLIPICVHPQSWCIKVAVFDFKPRSSQSVRESLFPTMTFLAGLLTIDSRHITNTNTK